LDRLPGRWLHAHRIYPDGTTFGQIANIRTADINPNGLICALARKFAMAASGP
jgi:hypothetical protein